MSRRDLVWVIVGVLAAVALLIYIVGHVSVK
jgi:hypothetical protein